jgi:hypothetical protein
VGTDYGKTKNPAHITTESLPTSNRIRCPHRMESPAHIDRNTQPPRRATSIGLSAHRRMADPQHLNVAHEISRRLKEIQAKPPGPEGTFGNLAFSHEILHWINDVGVEAGQAFLGLIDPEIAGQAAEDVGFHSPVLRREVATFFDFSCFWHTQPECFSKLPQDRHPERSASQIYRLTEGL